MDDGLVGAHDGHPADARHAGKEGAFQVFPAIAAAAIRALAANPSGRTLVIPIESAGLAGGITQALEAMRLGKAPE